MYFMTGKAVFLGACYDCPYLAFRANLILVQDFNVVIVLVDYHSELD
jgi:hypothetical protein